MRPDHDGLSRTPGPVRTAARQRDVQGSHPLEDPGAGRSLRRVRAALVRLLRPARAGYAALKRYVGHLVFERWAGIETATVVRLHDIGLAGKDRVDYEPTPWLSLGRVLRKSDVTEEDVFIDFGSGKGRVIVQAAMYPFRRVIGVELSEELHEIARANVARARPRARCTDIELVKTDVLEYEIPDDVTIAYFFNPFEGEVFGVVVEKLVASLRRRPRVLKIIYMNPVEEDMLLRAGAKLIKAANGLRPTKAWARESSIRLYALAAPTAEPPSGALRP